MEKEKTYTITISESHLDVIQKLMININNNPAFNSYQPTVNEIVKQIEIIKNKTG